MTPPKLKRKSLNMPSTGDGMFKLFFFLLIAVIFFGALVAEHWAEGRTRHQPVLLSDQQEIRERARASQPRCSKSSRADQLRVTEGKK